VWRGRLSTLTGGGVVAVAVAPVASGHRAIVPEASAKRGIATHARVRAFHAGGVVAAPVDHNVASFQVKGTGAETVPAV
jgi:hypothetical protein